MLKKAVTGLRCQYCLVATPKERTSKKHWIILGRYVEVLLEDGKLVPRDDQVVYKVSVAP